MNVSFFRMSEVTCDPSFEKYISLVRCGYRDSGPFRRHIDNQVYTNLRPKLASIGIRRRNDLRLQELAEYLLLELALILWVSEENIADIQFGNEPEMGIVDSVFKGKYDIFKGVLKNRILYESIGQDLILENLTYSYSKFSIPQLNLSIPAGSRFGIIGPNGSGKTTILKLIGGHLLPTGGRVLLGESELTSRPPGQRPTATVFQDLALFPHLSVLRNICFGARYKRRLGHKEATKLAMEWSSRLELTKYEAYAPRNLSIGYQQRVAIARALATRPSVLLLDEPTASLDTEQKAHLASILRTACEEGWASTVVLVTHDFDFALRVCDHLAIFDGGRLLISGQPQKILTEPSTGRIAELFGVFNVLRGRLEGETSFVVEPDGPTVPTSTNGSFTAASSLCLLISPYKIRVGTGTEVDVSVSGTVDDTSWTGNKLLLSVRFGFGVLRVISEVEMPRLRAGDEIQLSFRSQDTRVTLYEGV
jgi:ABC-type Fe3+/spermidine/putrescine transport system ATPase subunit